MNMIKQTLKRVKIKGKVASVIREQYLRDDISCCSPLCKECVATERLNQLPSEATHYALPCIDVILNYLEILELQEIKGLIILQSIITKILSSHGHKMYKRLLCMCKDIRQGSITFLNEICCGTSIVRSFSDSFDLWLIKSCVKAAEFYSSHLKGLIPVILITDNVENYKPHVNDSNVQIYTLKQYLETKCENSTTAFELYDSLHLAQSTDSVKDLSKAYDKYLPLDVLEAGIKAGRYMKGHLSVNKHNAQEEAFVSASIVTVKDCSDIIISGMKDRNRAIHGDEVAIELYPRSQWKSRCLKLVDNPYDSRADTTENGDLSSSLMPTGRVVGVLERNWRNYVVTFPEEEESSIIKNRERILAVPYNYRIPKIRIATRQADSIRNQRILVRIDSWDVDSQYPNGHLVRTLGEIGKLETEVNTLLIEHDVFVGEFPQNLIPELPKCTEDNPWVLEETEIKKRKDLRDSHLIFSIDPKGCEDVDDTLSVRVLPNGLLELGVHIADVTYFVPEQSLVDLEARSRSTSVYLPDRRYDMLPHILSGNLCSLLGNLDRYAVSVLWDLNKKGEVQNVWYGRTIIKSKYKLCYEAAQQILYGADQEEMISEIPELHNLNKKDLNKRFKELKNSLFLLYDIANVIRKNRLHTGGLELNSVDMKFEIDHSLPSIISDIKVSKELAIHKTVAECMIFANNWVAKKICDIYPHQAVLRRHPHPRHTDLAALQKLAATKGFSLSIQSNNELAKSLDQAVDSNDPSFNQILRIMATQSMNQATYCCTGNLSEAELSHYGLGLEKYTHFTSPIRRYADVIVHRLLLSSVDESDADIKLDLIEIEELCTHMNRKHKAAQELEKDAQQLFLSHYFENLFSSLSSCLLVDAIIYSLRSNGMLVFVPKYGIKGAICLCNKEKKVAVANEKVEWTDGKLLQKEKSIIVEAGGLMQEYSIFDHITACVKVVKSRSHQNKVVLELANKKPYILDWEDNLKARPKNLDLKCEEKEESSRDQQNQTVTESAHQKTQEFDLYSYLQRLKDFTIADEPYKSSIIISPTL